MNASRCPRNRGNLGRANRAEEEKLVLAESAQRLQNENDELRTRSNSLLTVQQESGRAYSEMAAQLESERRRVEEENAWLKGRLATREQNVAEQSRLREALAAEVAERNRELKSLKAQFGAAQSELLSSRETVPRLQERLKQLEEANDGLRDHNAALSESVDDLKGSSELPKMPGRESNRFESFSNSRPRNPQKRFRGCVSKGTG